MNTLLRGELSNMEFKYKAFYEGQIIEGLIEGESKWDAVNKLKNQGMTVLKLDEISAQETVADYKFLEKFTRQLYQLLKSGLTADRAILFIYKSEKKYNKQLENVLNSIREGSSLSNALKNTGVFPKSYIEMIKSGEESGSLEEILELLLNAIIERNELRKHILSALIYPSFLFIVSILSFLLISLYVIPKFKIVIQSTDIKLPLITRVAFFISDIFSYMVVALILMTISSILLLNFLKRRNARMVESLILKLPLIGSIVLQLELTKFSQSMHFLLKSNIPLNQALDISIGTVAFQIIREKLDEVKKEVIKGSSMSYALNKYRIFPSVLIELVAVGEQTGELHSSFYRIYTQFSEDFKDKTKKFISLLEPSVVVIMGIVIGFLVFSMMLAVFSISSGI